MSRRAAPIEPKAPVRFVPQTEFEAYYGSLEADARWTNPERPGEFMIWHWGEGRWWAPEERC